MEPDLKGKGLFVFSDPGGAKPILSFISLNKQIRNFLVISDRVYDFYSDFNIPVVVYEEGSQANIIEQFNPDFVFTGTSYTSKIELKFIAAAKNKRIITYSFIDHYTYFLERFRFENDYIFPDNTCVLDDNALQIARENMLPGTIIVTGNYYHKFIKNWQPDITKEFFFKNIGIPSTNKVIVFAADPLTNVGGIEKYGLDEISVFVEVDKALGYIDCSNITLVVKQHPNQNKRILNEALVKSRIENIIPDYCGHTNNLLYFSDLTIGIFSSILIEAALLETDVIRCLIGLKQPDPFSNLKIGSIGRSSEELKYLLKKNIGSSPCG